MIKKILFLLFLLLSGCHQKKDTTVSDPRNDSVRKYLDLASNRSLKDEFRSRYTDIAFSFMDLSVNSKQKREQLNLISEMYYSHEKDKFKEVNEELLILALRSNDSMNIGRAYRNFGLYHLDKSNYDEAIKFLYKSEFIFSKLENADYLGRIYLDKAFIFLYENDYVNCESLASKALSVLNDKKHKRGKYDAYNLIAISSNELKNYERAIEYHQKALSIAKNDLSEIDSNLMANSENNIGVVYQNLNQHDKAIKYFKSALLSKGLLSQYPDIYAMLIDNLAYSKNKIGDNGDLPALFFKALKIRNKNRIYSGVVISKLHLSEYYYKVNDSIQSKKFALEALALAKSTKIAGDILASLDQLSKVEKKNAIIYLKEYIRIKDSLQIAERYSKDKFARIIYETDEIKTEKETAVKQK